MGQRMQQSLAKIAVQHQKVAHLGLTTNTHPLGRCRMTEWSPELGMNAAMALWSKNKAQQRACPKIDNSAK
jgi:hypothetical protein